ncbi:unnamed protein product [Pleuronectes platessa]|uniref:Uncharacterized protein n=1 Tax=Pleuronectes platessa TaxID=8262 RepID=A0A9N7VMV7_PLEPL|nr:unnamed protein product [Pleuronectes platessa]
MLFSWKKSWSDGHCELERCPAEEPSRYHITTQTRALSPEGCPLQTSPHSQLLFDCTLHNLELHCSIEGKSTQIMRHPRSTVPGRKHLRWHLLVMPVTLEAIRTIKPFLRRCRLMVTGLQSAPVMALIWDEDRPVSSRTAIRILRLSAAAARCLSSRRLRRKMAGTEDAAVTQEDSNNCSEQMLLQLRSPTDRSQFEAAVVEEQKPLDLAASSLNRSHKKPSLLLQKNDGHSVSAAEQRIHCPLVFTSFGRVPANSPTWFLLLGRCS